MSRPRYDLVVVGGGIQGAFLTLEASRRGLSVLLLERDRIGMGTSDQSLRVVHGGFRYLQTLDIARFRRSRQEQQWFFRHLAEFVSPLECILPLSGRGMKRRSLARVGGVMDKLLDRDRLLPPPRVLNRVEWKRLLPGASGHAAGALVWHDGLLTSGRNVVRALADWAKELGATVAEDTTLTDVVLTAGRVAGVRGSFDADADMVVFAAGHANGDLTRRFAPRFAGSLPAWVSAYNVILDRPPVLEAGLAFDPHPGPGAALFGVPREGRTALGTLYTPLEAEGPLRIPEQQATADLLVAYNRAVRSKPARLTDVVGYERGCLPADPTRPHQPASRPLIWGGGRDGTPQGMWFVVPEKLTTARSVAEVLLREAVPHLPPVRAGSERVPSTPVGVES